MQISPELKNKLIMIGIFLLALASILILSFNKLNLGLDLRGGLRLVIEGKDTAEIKVTNEAMDGAMEVIRSRVDGLGVAEPIIQRKGERQIEIELPGIKDEKRALALIGEIAILEFKEAEWVPGDISMLSEKEKQELLGSDGKLDSIKITDVKGNVVKESPIILRKTVMIGNDLKDVNPDTDQYGRPVVALEFNAEGSKKFYAATLRSVGKPLAILLDGKIISAPNVNEAISGGRAQISGSFSVKEMQDLVIKLRGGSLPVPVEIVENKIIGPTLGEDSIAKSKMAGLIGFALIAVFMIGYYRFNGLIAVSALAMYSVMDLAVLSLAGVTLTLPGIAGVILSIGMAVDANVIIFERLREEIKAGRTIHNAIDVAFKHAFTAIIDSNLTTIFAVLGLFIWGSGSVKGFAWTLTIGIIISMFTAITVTKQLMNNFYSLKPLKEAAPKLG